MLEILMSQINFFVINVMPFGVEWRLEWKRKKKVAISLIFMVKKRRMKKANNAN
jgi:hypothetical protein